MTLVTDNGQGYGLIVEDGTATDFTCSTLNAMLSVGILCDDAALVDYALAYPTTGAGTGNVNNAVTPTEVTTTIPANTPVLIMAEAGDYTFTGSSIWQKATTTTAGALTGVFQRTIVPTGSYILTKKNDVVAFRKVDGTTNYVEANRAYLTASATAPVLDINFDGNVAGINTLNGERGTLNGERGTLNGER